MGQLQEVCGPQKMRYRAAQDAPPLPVRLPVSHLCSRSLITTSWQPKIQLKQSREEVVSLINVTFNCTKGWRQLNSRLIS